MSNDSKLTFKQKLKQRKARKRKKRLWYKVLSQKKKPHKVLYGLEVFFAFLVEFFRVFFKTLAIEGVFGLIIGFVVYEIKYKSILEGYYQEASEIVASSGIEDFKISESSIIYDSKGKEIANLHVNSDLVYLDYDDIPEDVIDAFIAVEDRTFWTNKGIDLKGITRILVDFVQSKGEEKHGASTITQQLARNVYLTHEVSMERKIKEMFISLELTKKYSKEDIMEYYVNNICFANGIYGIGGASRAYFNKEVNELSLSQLVYLCAIPNRPEYYDPYDNPENAIKRRDKILHNMLEVGFISDKEYTKATSEEIKIKKPKYAFNNYQTTYATDCAVRYLMKLDGFKFKYSFKSMEEYKKYKESYDEEYQIEKHNLYTKGYRIYTSLNTKLTKKLQKVVDNQLAFNTEKDKNTKMYALQGALTCVDNKTRKVVAVIGGRSQKNKNSIYGLNRAYQSPRQPGSSFKPLAVYTPILEEGYNADSIVQNIDVSVAKQTGVNAQTLRGESMTLRSAVENSRNGVAWQLFDRLTPKKGLSYINKMKFASVCPSDYYNSASLGGLTYGVTTVEMAGAYSTLANHGKFVEPTCLTSILDKEGNELYKKSKSTKVYTSKASDDMIDILKGVLTRGTARSLYWSSSSNTEAFAKTGTTNDSKDGWLCGATPYYSIAVWVGYDSPKTLSNLYGGTYPANIWKEAMLTAINGKKDAVFVRDNDDKSYTTSQTTPKGYYSYLAGRSDSEVLSSGYTVADYRKDRVIGESVYEVIDEINNLDMSKSGSSDKLEELYKKGLGIIDTIYSIKYTAEMKGYLNTAYYNKK